MRIGRGFAGILRYITIHRSRFWWLVGGMLTSVITLGIASYINQSGISLLAIATTMIISFFLGMNVWAAHKHTNAPDYDHLFQMGQMGQHDTFILLEFGEKTVALDLYPQLTGGNITVIDIYNPLLHPSSTLTNARAYYPIPPKDPRLVWQDGHFSRLSLPNNGVDIIMLPHIVSHFAEWGDQKLLLQEIYRLLKPEGKLLLAEQVRTPTQWLVNGWETTKLDPPEVWSELIQRMGFQIKEQVVRSDMSLCVLAEKPSRSVGQQLTFDFPTAQ